LLLAAASIKLVAEIALLAMAGQWLLGLLVGAQRDSNVFYRLLQVLTNPFIKAVRAVAPRAVIDRHVPAAAFVLLALVWLAATLAKIGLCLQIGIQACR
jgi:hypothetical protein